MKTNRKDLIFKKQNKISEWIGSLFFICCSAIILFICIQSGMGEDIWFDEVFSMNFLKRSYGEIAKLTAADVHPPFYYWYLKAFHDLIKVIFPGASTVVLAKMASVLPFLGIWVYAFTLIRKRAGILVMSVFLFFVSAMPQISNYTVEVRMYSLAMFLITAAFLHSYEIVLENKRIHWILFCIYGIVTAYTQYYACVAIVGVYIALFMYSICHKQKKQLVAVLMCAGISVLAYLPWIPSFISQFQTVSGSYWIQPLTFRSIFGCMKFVFLPVSFSITKNYVLAVLMIGIFAICFCYAIWKEKTSQVRYLLLCGVFVPVFTAFTGFVCSALNRPVFVYRYLIPGLGAMWFVVAYVILKYRKEMLMFLVLIPFILAGHSNMQGFYAEESKKLVQMEATQEFLADFPEDAVILCNFNHVQALTAYYLDNQNILYGGEPESLIAKMQPECVGMPDIAQLPQLVKEQDVYFLGSFEAREELLEEWAEAGITYTEDGTYLLERYYFNVYHLKMENK